MIIVDPAHEHWSELVLHCFVYSLATCRSLKLLYHGRSLLITNDHTQLSRNTFQAIPC